MNKCLIHRFEGEFNLYAEWDSPQWETIPSIRLENRILTNPSFLPKTELKIMYDDNHIYVFFKVEDRYVRAVNTEINSPVSNDSCVEFFFTPNEDINSGYFNLEVNCGGTPLIRFQKSQKVGEIHMDIKDIKKIKIDHSLPRVVDPEIKNPVIWTLKYSIPLAMLNKYYSLQMPKKGVTWHANFYKCGNETSNPHYLAWNNITHPDPHFHMPEYFGVLEFM